MNKLPDPGGINNESKDIMISPSQENMSFPINTGNHQSEYSIVNLKQEDVTDIITR